jgi:hypothetical protein
VKLLAAIKDYERIMGYVSFSNKERTTTPKYSSHPAFNNLCSKSSSSGIIVIHMRMFRLNGDHSVTG